MRNRQAKQQQQGDCVHRVKCGVLSSMWGDRSMKDQKLYLISKEEQRVAFHLLTAIELSERLEEFVRCMMKLRATLNTSLLLLLEMKAYPVNCSTHILHIVVRFCKAKLSLDHFRIRGNNFMSTTEERSYWITFLWRDLDACATLLQVGRDLAIKSLIQVVLLVHEPACTAFLRRQEALDVDSDEERRHLLSSLRVGAAGGNEAGVRSPLRNQPRHCLPRFKIANIGTALFGTFTGQGSPGGRNWGRAPKEVVQEKKSSDSQEHVMSLSELMRLESVVDTVNDADNLRVVVDRLSKEFDLCVASGSVCSTTRGSKHAARTIKKHRLSKNWSYPAFSNRSPVEKGARSSSAKKKVVRFQISPQANAGGGDGESLVDGSLLLGITRIFTTRKALRKSGESSSCTADAENTDEMVEQVSLDVKRGRKEKLFSGLKAAARTLGISHNGKGSSNGKSSKGTTTSSPHLSEIALSHG